MIEKALKYLVDTAQAAATPKLVCESDRETRYNVGGGLVVVAKPPPLVDHWVSSLADLAAAVLKFADSEQTSSVWHCSQGVIGLLDNADRRDVVRFQLIESEPFAVLRRLEEDRPLLGQRDFIELLDVTLGVDKAIIAPFRRLDWDQMIRASGEITQTKDRMGREITAQVAGTAELPSDVLVNVPIYRQFGERELYRVLCSIRLRPGDQRIAFRPVPGEIDTAVELAQASIRERLEGLLPKTAIFYGSP